MTDMPADVIAFLSRANACHERMQQALGCGELPAEQHALCKRYADQPFVLHALDQWFFKVVERVPVNPLREVL